MALFTIRTARESDLETVRELLAMSERRLRPLGFGQWSLPMPDDLILPSIRRQETYLVDDGVGEVATVTLNKEGTPFWPAECTDALFVHRLVVIPRGTGLGVSLLDWSGEQAQKAGKSWLRIDVWKTNRRLHSYYRGLGFEPRGIKHVPGAGSGALFARPAGSRVGSGPSITAHERHWSAPAPNSPTSMGRRRPSMGR
ncbi:GNAT family N-acetyltransferase [Streptomyces sp. NPDC051776]|uniref:GNAT family N-acetyltransferase n=1 Tax=Streptomyces sp. NPDC051776 TaxID=3155414 RepID=UPI0034453ADC